MDKFLDAVIAIFENGDVVMLISIFIIFLFSLSLFRRRSTKYRILTCFGIWLFLLGLAGLGLYVAKYFFDTVEIVDLNHVIKIGLGLVLLIIIGIIVTIIAGKSSYKHHRYERRIRRFYDVWNSAKWR